MACFRSLANVLCFALLVTATGQNIQHEVFKFKTAYKAQANAQRLANALAATTSAIDTPSSSNSAGTLITPSSSFQIYTNGTLPTSPAPPAACAAALTSSIFCNYTIQYMSYAFDDASLAAMCTSTCSSSLVSYRNSVAGACSGYSFPGINNQTYQATLAIDTMSEPYFSQCRTDATTGKFCADVLATYTTSNPSQGILGYPQNEVCSSCMLGLLNTTLSSPIMFSNALYDTLQSALQTCGSSWASYNVTPPSAANPVFTPGLSTQPLGSNTTVDSICAVTGRNVTLSSLATCQSIAKQFSITQQDILDNNPTLRPANCTAGISSGTQLCLPESCTLYTIQANQTCDDVVDDVNSKSLIGNQTIGVAQLESFNPGLNSLCTNIATMDTVCITPHGGFPTVGNDGGIAVPNPTPTAVVSPPGQTALGTTSACGLWYLVQPGNICQQVALNNSITLDDLITLNPEINENCTNLWANYYYCVAPYPPFNLASSVPIVTANFSSAVLTTIPLTTATTSTPLPILSSYTGMAAPTNLADGTITNGCGYYYTVEDGDNCTSVEQYFDISDTDFQDYNYDPSAPCPSLSVGSAVCVQVLNTTDTIPPTPTNAAQGSAPSGCGRWYTIVFGDGCTSVESKFELSASQFFALNPELKTDCSNLALGEAYCVRAIGQVSAAVPSNAASGTDNNDCAKYDTVISGDSCPVIESRNNITDALFRALNPEINVGCTNIQLGLAYCVAAVPSYTLSATSTPTSTPTNVASGTDTKDCVKYDTVISGDNCPVIESRNNISDPLFRALNPEIDSACTNLQLGVAYCVQAVPGFTPTATTTTTTLASTPTNIASGSWTNCTTYYSVVTGDNCAEIDTKFNIAFADLLNWNPEINTACGNLQLAAYCVKGSGACPKIYTVASGGDSCGKIESSFGLTDAQFRSINPWLDSNCDIQPGQNMCVGLH